MITQEQRKNAMYQEGRRQALDLQERSSNLTGTELIAEEEKIPAFDPQKDYSDWKAGYPVSDDNQIWILLQPHNAANYNGRPSTLRALWGLAHTTDPNKAKPWVEPYGTSGLYMKDECYCDENGIVYKCKVDNTVYNAAVLPDSWEKV